ncbi:hypothetical protein BC01_089 [Bacillus phage BC01]|nr:hypothetical protein BC01_089 [Bacillus phage BC01]
MVTSLQWLFLFRSRSCRLPSNCQPMIPAATIEPIIRNPGKNTRSTRNATIIPMTANTAPITSIGFMSNTLLVMLYTHCNRVFTASQLYN